MEREYFLPLLNSIKLSIFRNLEFETALNARLVCTHWNDLLSTEVLPYRSKLNIKIDKTKISKQFRRGKWMQNITILWDEITVHYPENPYSFRNTNIFNWGDPYSSSFHCFREVTKLILFECGKGAFLDFVHSMLCGLPHLRHVEIKSQHWNSHAALEYQPSLSYQSNLSSWGDAVRRAEKLTTFKIAVFEKRTTVKYLSFLSLMDTPLKLVTLDVDFSKNCGLPFEPIVVDEISQVLIRVIQNCSETLRYLRLKWDHRVEGDMELVQYSRDFDPYAQFLLMVSSNVELFHNLRLKRLSLNFPVIAFAPIHLLNEVMIPFIKSQISTLDKLTLSRVRWEISVRAFLHSFSPEFQEKIEMGVFMVDVDTWIQDGLKLYKGVSKVEFHSLRTVEFDLSCINARKIKSKRTGIMKYKKNLLTSLRFQNSVLNPSLSFINIRDIIQNFRTILDLELIDHSETPETRSISNFELNHIFLKLPQLKSLKLTNLQDISDAGLTNMKSSEISKMKDIGVYYPLPPKGRIPIIQAKNLTFLELRDLSHLVSDLSVFVAFQFIPKLDKISLYGQHQITDWGKNVLERKFKRNPRFEAQISKEQWKDSFGDYARAYMVDFP